MYIGDQSPDRTPEEYDEQDIMDEATVHPFIANALRFWNEAKETSDRILTDTGVYSLLDKLARKSAQHPFLALGMAIACIAVALPFLIVLAFALSTVVMTFTGFIFLEGTLITIASILMFGCLGAVLLILLFFGAITLTGYFGFLHIYDLFSGIHEKKALNNFLNREKSENN